MPAVFYPVGDFAAVCDGLQAVTLTDRDGNEQPIDAALRRAVTLQEAERSGGLYTTSDVHWHLPQSEVTTGPQPGYVVTDAADDEWTVLAVENQTLGDRWRLTCRNLVIAERLDTLVTIQVSTSVKGDTGAHEQTWADQANNIRARIQRAAGQVRATLGTRQVDATHTMYFRESIPLTARHRVVDSRGNRYRVIGWRDPERIDKLCEADLVPWTDDYLSGEIQ